MLQNYEPPASGQWMELAGFNVQKTMKGLRDKGLLVLENDSSGKVRTKPIIRIGGKVLRGYVIRVPRDGSKPSDDETEEDMEFLR